MKIYFIYGFDVKKLTLLLREIIINSNIKVKLDLNNPVYRFRHNPILTAHDVNKVWIHPALQVITVHNAGIAEYNREFIMLFRSHLRSGVSILGIARSKNGIDNWQVDPFPAQPFAQHQQHDAGKTEPGVP